MAYKSVMTFIDVNKTATFLFNNTGALTVIWKQNFKIKKNKIKYIILKE